jgi:hypothetical protein
MVSQLMVCFVLAPWWLLRASETFNKWQDVQFTLDEAAPWGNPTAICHRRATQRASF